MQKIITSDYVIPLLKSYYSKHAEEHGITKLGVFGSVAKGISTNKSDLDVVVILKEPKMFEMVAIKEELEDLFHTSVDLVRYRERMNSFLKNRIDQEVLYV